MVCVWSFVFVCLSVQQEVPRWGEEVPKGLRNGEQRHVVHGVSLEESLPEVCGLSCREKGAGLSSIAKLFFAAPPTRQFPQSFTFWPGTRIWKKTPQAFPEHLPKTQKERQVVCCKKKQKTDLWCLIFFFFFFLAVNFYIRHGGTRHRGSNHCLGFKQKEKTLTVLQNGVKTRIHVFHKLPTALETIHPGSETLLGCGCVCLGRSVPPGGNGSKNDG